MCLFWLSELPRAQGKRLSESRVLQILEEEVCQFNVKKLLDVDPESQ